MMILNNGSIVITSLLIYLSVIMEYAYGKRYARIAPINASRMSNLPILPLTNISNERTSTGFILPPIPTFMKKYNKIDPMYNVNMPEII